MNIAAALGGDLYRVRAQDRWRRVQPAHGVDFASNDYLAFATDPALADAARAALDRGVPVGAGGSRLLRGNHPEHEALEAEAAAFFGAETATFFPTGFAANATLLATLPQADDLVVHDSLVHASSHDGMKRTRARCVDGGHNDPGRIADLIAAWRVAGGRGTVWIVAESIYSMDGDRAPLLDLAAVAARCDAVLLLDEAHATGIAGPGGRGLATAVEGRCDLITLHTCGKALGAEGALVCAPRLVRDAIVNRGRAFIFSTAPSPLIAAVLRAALPLVAAADDRRAALERLVAHAGVALCDLPGMVVRDTPIQPLVIGDSARTMAIAAVAQAAGYDVRGIRPPTVPPGQARLRIAITLNATRENVDGLARVLREALA